MGTLKRSGPWLLVSFVLGALVALQTYAWQAWLRDAPVAQQSEAAQAIVAHLIAQQGPDVAAFTLPAPAMLTSFAMVCWLVLPSLLCILAISRHLVGVGSLPFAACKLGLQFSVLLALCFLMAAIASASLPAGLPWTQQLAWAGSYWLRTAVYALPFAASFTAVASLQTRPLLRVVSGLVTLLLMQLVAGLAPETWSTFLPLQLTQSLVRLEPHLVARGVLVSLAWSATFVFVLPLVVHKLRARIAAHRGVDMTATKQRQVVAAVLVAATLASASPALAYSKPGHFGITDAAWHIMRAGASSRISEGGLPQLLTPPSGVDKKDWEAYIAELTAAHAALGNLPIDVPDAAGGSCLAVPESTALNKLRTGVTPNHLALMDNKVCGVDPAYSPGALYRVIAPRDDAPYGGTALGFHAKNRDDDLNETRIDTLPVVRTFFELSSTAWTAATASLFVPFVCAYKAIATLWGGGGNCIDDARALANKGDFFAAISGSIPGISIPRSEDYIGFWHLINVRQGGPSNTYDDNQGMYLIEGGPSGLPGALDFASVAASLAGSVNLAAKDSTGVRRYSVESSADGHAATRHRADWEWSAHPFGVTPMSPLDNLAYGGYNLAGLGRTERLGWPLHAIGDATVPMHVVASPGWGHQPYEDWVESHLDVLLNNPKCPDDGTDCTRFHNDQMKVELAQTQRVLALSYRWRTFLKTHGIRDLITELAKQTLQKAGGDRVSGWAWCDSCTVFYNTGKVWKEGSDAVARAAGLLNAWDGKFDPVVAHNPEAYYSQFTENIRSLVEDAMGAKIAFLIWASQQK